MDLKRFYSLCLQGDVIKAVDYLNSCDDIDEDGLELKRKYESRFVNRDEEVHIESDDPWVRSVVKCYNTYFINVLTGGEKDQAQHMLTKDLGKILGIEDEVELWKLEEKAKEIFKEKGYTFLGGRTMPYFGPYIWKTTKREDFKVELPCGEQSLTVFFISDFLMLSWIHFATFGRKHAGGWAKDEGIYYVNTKEEDVDTKTADFQVWFLKHEAQHQSDYEKYPNLSASQLEYRAKLVELIYNEQPAVRFKDYIYEAKDDESLPHSYAAYMIIKRLANKVFGDEDVNDIERWEKVDNQVISENSLKLFMENEELEGKY